MPVKLKLSWLLLLVRLPATHKAERVAIWRKLRKSGAIPLQTSTYVLPEWPPCYETFQWLTQQIRDAGGDATLVRAREIEGLSNEKLVALFNAARAKEYAALRQAARSVAENRKQKSSSVDRFDRIRKQFREIRQTDFFNCPRAREVEVLLGKLEGPHPGDLPSLKVKRQDYQNKVWVTRPRPEIDRVGSAWLIRKFIDPGAKFIFAKAPSANRRAVSFDMLDGDFTHRDDDCTFETLLKGFTIRDKTVHKIGQMIHDADLDDEKFERIECVGVDRVLKGWGKEGLSDQEILRRGWQCFDALYAFLLRV
ncbi:MAG TPA: chromate resistance protein ChrB domain-containing protein [Chthoniobacterales bacterium]|jgi:hypothetical protein|nr:chromate resistance protein ChrB domain-containing protein [Chthoniobacterales bacterium]